MTEPIQDFSPRDVHFVKDMLSSLSSVSHIRKALIKRGYTETDANQLIEYASNQQASTGKSPSFEESSRISFSPRDITLVKDMMSSTIADYQIREALVKRGYSATAANQLIRQIRDQQRNQFYKPSKNKRGKQKYYPPPRSGGDGSGKIALGFLIAGVGCAITFFTYSSASSSSSGGTYIVAYGPIIWGGFLIFKGLMNSD